MGEDSIFCFPCFSFWRFDLLQLASSSSSSLRHAFIIQAFYFRFFADFFLLRFENEVNEYYHYLWMFQCFPRDAVNIEAATVMGVLCSYERFLVLSRFRRKNLRHRRILFRSNIGETFVIIECNNVKEHHLHR